MLKLNPCPTGHPLQWPYCVETDSEGWLAWDRDGWQIAYWLASSLVTHVTMSGQVESVYE